MRLLDDFCSRTAGVLGPRQHRGIFRRPGLISPLGFFDVCRQTIWIRQVRRQSSEKNTIASTVLAWISLFQHSSPSPFDTTLTWIKTFTEQLITTTTANTAATLLHSTFTIKQGKVEWLTIPPLCPFPKNHVFIEEIQIIQETTDFSHMKTILLPPPPFFPVVFSMWRNVGCTYTTMIWTTTTKRQHAFLSKKKFIRIGVQLISVFFLYLAEITLFLELYFGERRRHFGVRIKNNGCRRLNFPVICARVFSFPFRWWKCWRWQYKIR